jgi:hypothetical protein
MIHHLWALPVSVLALIIIGATLSIVVCYDCKALVRNRLRARRVGRARHRLSDDEHVRWAQHLVAARRDAP